MKKILSILAFLCAAWMSIQAERVILGAEQTKQYLPLLKGKRVALLSNHTGIVIQAKGERLRAPHDTSVVGDPAEEVGHKQTR